MEPATTATGLRSLPRRQVVLTMAGVMLSMFLSSLDQTVVGTAMPRIISDLGGFSHYTWVTTSYLITSTVVVPIVGNLTDLYGRKPFYVAGLVIFTLASLMCGLSNTLTEVIIYRGIQGIGAGVMIANAFTVIADLFPPADRGKYQGLMTGVFGVSSVLGPVLGGFITDALSWHWVFFVNVPLGVLITVLFIFFFPNIRPEASKREVDYLGVVAIILTVVPLMLALSWGGVEYRWVSLQIIGMFAFSAVMGLLFLKVESRSKQPIIPLSLFRNRIFAISEIIIFFTAFGMFGSIIFIPLYFQGVLGLSATASGSFMTPMTIGIVVGSLASGQMLSRAGGHYRLQGGIGIAIMAVGLGLLSRMTAETSFASAVVNIVITGIGLGTVMPLYIIAVQNVVPQNLLGTATSSTAFFRSIGASLALAIFGSVMSNRFASQFVGDLPATVKAIIPPERLSAMARNPQALLSVEAQAELKGALAQLGPQGAALYDQLLQGLRRALESALTEVFLLCLIAVLIALAFNFFIKEVPLRRQHGPAPSSDHQRK